MTNPSTQTKLELAAKRLRAIGYVAESNGSIHLAHVMYDAAYLMQRAANTNLSPMGQSSAEQIASAILGEVDHLG